MPLERCSSLATGASQLVVEAVVRPGQCRGVRLREDRDLAVGNTQAGAGGPDLAAKAAEDVVATHEVPDDVRVGQVVIAITSRSASRSRVAVPFDRLAGHCARSFRQT
jgi:hypothetical protein